MFLDEAIDKIRSTAQRHAVSGDHENLWDTILAQIAAQDSCDHDHPETLLRLISEFLAGLEDGAVVALWGQTETGMADDPEETVAGFVRWPLSDEVLEAVLKAAWDEAK